ncbi:MAG: hypothetical protein JKY66_07605, partial [Spongiibacteraceae bacterium]|nr:hypothetical protein [Spongiibacteraceae bacterium]
MADKTNIASNTPNTHKTHVVAVVVYDGVIPTDASIPCDAFARVTLNDGRHPYRIKVCAVSPTINAGFFHLNAPFTLA